MLSEWKEEVSVNNLIPLRQFKVLGEFFFYSSSPNSTTSYALPSSSYAYVSVSPVSSFSISSNLTILIKINQNYNLQ